MEGSNIFSSFSGLRENFHRYLDSRFQFYKLVLLDKASRAITTIVASVVVAVFGLLAIIFLSVALALYLGQVIPAGEPNYILGLLIVGGLYILLAIILFSMRKTLFSGSIIKNLGHFLFENNEDEDS